MKILFLFSKILHRLNCSGTLSRIGTPSMTPFYRVHVYGCDKCNEHVKEVKIGYKKWYKY